MFFNCPLLHLWVAYSPSPNIVKHGLHVWRGLSTTSTLSPHVLELSNIGDTGQGWTPGQSGACTGHWTLPDAAARNTGEADTEDGASIYSEIETATETAGIHQMRIMMKKWRCTQLKDLVFSWSTYNLKPEQNKKQRPWVSEWCLVTQVAAVT